MNLVDTSVWVEVLRDRSLAKREAFRTAMADEPVVISRLVEYELLAGCRDHAERRRMLPYLDDQIYLPSTTTHGALPPGSTSTCAAADSRSAARSTA